MTDPLAQSVAPHDYRDRLEVPADGTVTSAALALPELGVGRVLAFE